MNDTNREILLTFPRSGSQSSSQVHSILKNSVSLVTVKRALRDLRESGYLQQSGGGRSIKYSLSKKGILLRPVSAKNYTELLQEERSGESTFNHHLFSGEYTPLLTDSETQKLKDATHLFADKASQNQEVHSKELQRFMVEMSWKSGRIEGNTYTLLDTERLLAYGVVSERNTQFETQMLLDQKAAFDFVWKTKGEWKAPTIPYIEQLHSLIIKDLGVAKNMRKTIVGITGTDYQPLENSFQIREALEQLLEYIEKSPDAYEQALLLTLGMSYIQPFADGNKRTARMTANALLLANNLAPISYRSVDEIAYKESLLVFYEQNSAWAFKELFLDQYIYSATHYNIAR